MNSFKEWLSDYLRYFILILAVILAVGAIFLGVKLYQSSRMEEGDPNSVTILDGSEAESQTEKITEKPETDWDETETEKQEKETEEKETDRAAASAENKGNGETGSSAADDGDSGTAGSEGAARQTSSSGTAGANASSPDTPETKAPETQAPETNPPETNPPETDPPEPVYLTMTGACYIRSYADYGDNIIGEYPAGTVVEFLEDVGGWYKVQVDGMVGYMGARFFS